MARYRVKLERVTVAFREVEASSPFMAAQMIGLNNGRVVDVVEARGRSPQGMNNGKGRGKGVPPELRQQLADAVVADDGKEPCSECGKRVKWPWHHMRRSHPEKMPDKRNISPEARERMRASGQKLAARNAAKRKTAKRTTKRVAKKGASK